MAHSLYWPGSYYFYPIGNTPAVCLTRDVAPRVPTNLLLLGCGDPRNVLYTVYCDQADKRALDFTCVDWDGGILARNTLLFSMIMDEIPHQTMWNIFYNMKLDKESYACLTEQSRKLADAAQTPQTWQASRYGKVLRMSSNQTLPEIRRHWLLYANMQSLSRNQSAEITSSYAKLRSSVLQNSKVPSARSAGPFSVAAFEISADIFLQYWETGALTANSQSSGPANLLNPTFAYSRGGDTNCTHYGTNPIVAFHLAPVFARGKGKPSMGEVVKDVLSQFASWCAAMSDAIRSPDSCPIIRFFWADALAASQCLKTFHANGKLSINVTVSQWKTQVIELSREEYMSAHAPSTFDVVDTSNLVDYAGLLNIIVASVPLLSSLSSSVLYTETLLHIRNDATTEFNEALHADFATFSLLTGVCPVDYLSGFVSRSNVHELFDHEAARKASSKSPKEPPTARQFQQVTTWKSPSSCYSTTLDSSGIAFEPRQLATFLYDMYHSVFEREDALNFERLHQDNFLRAALSFAEDHDIRESFVLFLKHVRSHLRLLDGQWREIMDWFFTIQQADHSMPMDANNRQDFWAQLHRHGLYTSPFHLKPFPTSVGPFSSWPSVPMLSRVVLVIPREKLDVLERSKSTPPLLCYVLGKRSHNQFSNVHVSFGRVIRTGTPANPSVLFEEDKDGFKGSSPLVASFVMPSAAMTSFEPPEDLTVHLALRSMPATGHDFMSKLGPSLSIHGSPLMDREYVHILPEQPLPKPPSPKPAEGQADWTFGPLSAPSVVLDEECEAVSVMVIRVAIKDSHVQKAFQGGESPSVTQHAPCTMRLVLGNRTQDVAFPFPVMGSQYKLRLARKSLYIEVVVPLSGGLRGEGMRLNRFPVTTGGVSGTQTLHFYPWSIHRVTLNTLPTLKLKNNTAKRLLDSHLTAALSENERKLLKKPESASARDVDATFAFLKEAIRILLARTLGLLQGVPPRRVFTLEDQSTNSSDTVLLINEVRLDVSSHTVVCDAFVLPLTPSLLAQHGHQFNLLINSGAAALSAPEGVMVAWKRLLPALAERCRTWEHGPNCEYVAAGRVPLSEEMEQVPLCSCGAGVDIEEMKKDSVWRPFAPHATRVAISPLFAVSYLERITRDPAAHRCALCRGKGHPKLKACTGCRKIRYCSDTCQKADWKAHKPKCKA